MTRRVRGPQDSGLQSHGGPWSDGKDDHEPGDRESCQGCSMTQRMSLDPESRVEPGVPLPGRIRERCHDRP